MCTAFLQALERAPGTVGVCGVCGAENPSFQFKAPKVAGIDHAARSMFETSERKQQLGPGPVSEMLALYRIKSKCGEACEVTVLRMWQRDILCEEGFVKRNRRIITVGANSIFSRLHGGVRNCL